MSKKVIIENLGTFEFGVNWFYKFFNEVSGKDILVGGGLSGIGNGIETFDVCVNLYLAGSMAEAKMTKSEALPKQTIEDYIMGLDVKGVGDLIKQYTDTLPKADPEGEANSQAGNP